MQFDWYNTDDGDELPKFEKIVRKKPRKELDEPKRGDKRNRPVRVPKYEEQEC